MAKQTDDSDVIFEVKDLKINAVRDDGSELPIVKGVDFKVRRGEVVALIGESGSGKTTISLSALGYCKPGLKFAGGEARLLGEDVTSMSTEQLRPVRGEKVAYLAQSAAATFNPSILINEQVRGPHPAWVKDKRAGGRQGAVPLSCAGASRSQKYRITLSAPGVRWPVAAPDGSDGAVR